MASKFNIERKKGIVSEIKENIEGKKEKLSELEEKNS